MKQAALVVLTLTCMGQMSPDVNPDAPQKSAVQPRKIADTANDLNLADRRQLEQWAEHCIILNGHVWSAETLSDREATTQRLKTQVNDETFDFVRDNGFRTRGFVDPYSQKGAPNYVRLEDRRETASSDGAVLIELSEAIADIPGAEVRIGKVSQLGKNSAICFTGNEQWLVIGIDTSGLASDDYLRVVARRVGTHSFTTVLGAPRTIHKYEKVEVPVDTEVRKATADDIYQAMVRRSNFSFPIYRPKWSPQSSPSYKSGKTGAGPAMSRSTRSLDRRGTYTWEWNCVERRINPSSKSN